jgi:hypothetical protein
MEKAGLKKSTADPCLFYCMHKDSFLYIWIYVDGGLVIVNKDEEIEAFLGLHQEESMFFNVIHDFNFKCNTVR